MAGKKLDREIVRNLEKHWSIIESLEEAIAEVIETEGSSTLTLKQWGPEAAKTIVEFNNRELIEILNVVIERHKQAIENLTQTAERYLSNV